MIYEIKRGSTVVLAIRANGKQHRAVMIEDRVQMDFRLPEPITFQQGDTVEVFGQIYKLNRSENVLISHDKAGYHYNMEFEALYYDLGKWELNTYDRNNQLKESEVFLMCDADTLMDLIVANANRVSSGWTKGVVEPTEVMMYTYTSAKLLTVLQDLADKNHTEFWVEGKTINLSRKQPVSGMVWEFGKDHELYELYRNRSDSPMINRLKVLGGTRNIPLDYGFKRLQPTGGNPISTPALGDIIEHTVVYENVYPSRKGSVTSVLADNEFSDSSIDFNLNNYKLPTPAKVAFTTGQLAGFVFSISEDGYNHDTKTITLNVINDDPAYPSGVPNPLMKPAIGDEYVLLDISLPTSYITAKENTLKSLGESYLVDYSISRYEWGCRLKSKYVLEEEIDVELGSIVNIKHADLGIDHDIRVSGFIRDLQEPYRYDVTLSNIITISELVRQRNASDQMSATITRSGISDGSVKSDDTLQSVTTRGATTDRAITVRGTRNKELLSIPLNEPLPEDQIEGEMYLFHSTGSGTTPPTPIDYEGGFASIFDITEDTILNWVSGMSRDDTGSVTDKSWMERFGNAVFVTRLFWDATASLWRDESNQVDLTYADGGIATMQFTSVRGLTRVMITGRGGGVPVGIWDFQDAWAPGQYFASQYVTAPDRDDPSVQAFYFKKGKNEITSTESPVTDTVNWGMVKMITGPMGPVPNHEFDMANHAIRFQIPGGEWGAWLPLPPGADGKEIELQRSATHLQWRLEGDADWNDLIPLADLKGDKGDDGKEVEMQVSSTHIQWRLEGESTWKNVIALSSLKGEAGDNGRNPEFGRTPTHLVWRLAGDSSWLNLVPLEELKGADGKDGVVIVAEGHFAFSVEDGDLILHYHDDDTPPDFHIDENGDLILEVN